jgi:hypothetical protein
VTIPHVDDAGLLIEQHMDLLRHSLLDGSQQTRLEFPLRARYVFLRAK